jgi:hypothetical protein
MFVCNENYAIFATRFFELVFFKHKRLKINDINHEKGRPSKCNF